MPSSKLRVSTFFGHLQLSTLDDLDCLEWLIISTLGNIFHLLNNIVALQNFAEDHVATIKPSRIDCQDGEEQKVPSIQERTR